MFSSNHYVPILKWKRAEQGALKNLDEKYKETITPLIQFVMPSPKPDEQLKENVYRFEKQLGKIPEKIAEVLGSFPVFVDFSLLFTTPLKVKSAQSILEKGQGLGISIIPVIHLNDEENIKAVVCSLAKEKRSGLCLRLIRSDLTDLAELNQKIQVFLTGKKLSEEEIDLLVDIKEINGDGNKYSQYLNSCKNIHNLLRWRSFTFASGAFPEDLSKFKLDEKNLIPRLDWQNWKIEISNSNIQRKPAFADYTIQHPIYKESSQFFHPTASIKYTLDDYWQIWKGRKQKFEDYLANAELLSKDDSFYGENFSYGDKYIAEKGQHYPTYMKNPEKEKGTGSTETWLRASINHHLVLVARQVSSLS